MRLSRKYLTILLILGALVSGPALARIEPTWLLGFDLGTTALDGNLVDDFDFRLGLRASWHPNDRIGVELEAATIRATYNVEINTLMVNAIVRLSPAERTATAYAKVGLGQVEVNGGRFPRDGRPGRTETDLGVQVGAGLLLLKPRGRVGARFEALALFEEALGFDSSHVSASAGLVIRLGRR